MAILQDIVLCSRASFGHPKPLKLPLRTSFIAIISKNVTFMHYSHDLVFIGIPCLILISEYMFMGDVSHPNIIPMTL